MKHNIGRTGGYIFDATLVGNVIKSPAVHNDRTRHPRNLVDGDV